MRTENSKICLEEEKMKIVNKNEDIINNEDNKIKMVYQINRKEESIKVLGSVFVTNNKAKCKLIINEREYDLCEFIKYNEYNINQDDGLLTIFLKGINTLAINKLKLKKLQI